MQLTYQTSSWQTMQQALFCFPYFTDISCPVLHLLRKHVISTIWKWNVPTWIDEGISAICHFNDINFQRNRTFFLFAWHHPKFISWKKNEQSIFCVSRAVTCTCASGTDIDIRPYFLSIYDVFKKQTLWALIIWYCIFNKISVTLCFQAWNLAMRPAQMCNQTIVITSACLILIWWCVDGPATTNKALFGQATIALLHTTDHYSSSQTVGKIKTLLKRNESEGKGLLGKHIYKGLVRVRVGPSRQADNRASHRSYRSDELWPLQPWLKCPWKSNKWPSMNRAGQTGHQTSIFIEPC